ncbi:MAG TPA: LysR family transcriptional regulator [Ramlibacter sp.]|nr:LysR family transcriptional regulator [Ramlibacter sp.]
MHAPVLKYFLEVARSGSIRKASAKLFVASSAINRHIIKLEEELGTELFDRLPTGLRLNAAGERLLRHVSTTLHDFTLLRDELHALQGDRRGHVALAAMDSLFLDFLPAVVEEFSSAYGAVTLALHAVPPVAIPEAIAKGEYDIGMTFTNRIPAGLQAVEDVALPLGIVMSSSHPLSKARSIDLAECASYPFVRSGGASPLQTIDSPEFTEFWNSISPIVESNWTPLLKRLIVAGKGIGIFTQLAFFEELSSGDVVWKPLKLDAANAIRVGVVVAVHRPLSSVATAFVELACKRLKDAESQALF